MAFVKFPLPLRHVARTVSNEPFVRLVSKKNGRRLVLSPRVMEGSGIVKGDQLVIEHDEERVDL